MPLSGPLSSMPQPVEHSAVRQSSKVGVLLVNLGTPGGTDYRSIRRFLSEFLSDPRVVEIPRVLWQPLLQWVILPLRSKKTGISYDKIWLKDTDESPLRRYTREQAEKLSERFDSDEVIVDWAMRYGTPSIASRLKRLKEQGCQRISIMALYPQYSATTTATVYDTVFAELQKMRSQPAIRTLPAYYNHPKYIQTLGDSILQQIEISSWQPEVVLLSYHGLPQRNVDQGDPYYDQCCNNTRLLREYLGWDEQQLQMSFQSRFGRAAWLQPYTEPTFLKLAEQGVKRVMVAAPSFVSDCVETLGELGLEGREVFMQAGGEKFELIPCLNASPGSIDLLQQLAQEELVGWINSD